MRLTEHRRPSTSGPAPVGAATAGHGWNHNIQYHPVVLSAAPTPCERALDVGCGDGALARALLSISRQVVGIDVDAGSIEGARARGDKGVEYVLGDFIEHPFTGACFDLVASVAALHHMDAEAALTHMAYLLRPGGVLVVVGLARSRHLMDFAFDAAGIAVAGVHRYVLRKGYREPDAPSIWPPSYGYAELRRTAGRLLPGARFRRHVLWRYSLVWTRPRRDDP